MTKLTSVSVMAIALSIAMASDAATLVVDQRGARAADPAAGTATALYKTIGAAAGAAKPGDTILVRNGTYRETVKLPEGTARERITLKAWPGHHPVVTGSDIVRGPWRKAHIAIGYRPGMASDDDNSTSKGGAPELLQAYIDYLSRQRSVAGASTQIGEAAWVGENPDVPFVGIYACELPTYTQMVFVDGKPLQGIGPYEYIGPQDWPGLVYVEGKSPADMRPGSFCYDKQSKMLYVWLADSSSPAKHTVEASARYCGIDARSYTTIDGIDVRHCQMSPNVQPGEAAIHALGKHIVVERCRSTHNDFSGMIVQGQDCIVRGCELAYNGNDGYTATDCDRMLFQGNDVHHNNTRRYASGWHDGGVKVTDYRDSKFIGNRFHDEPGNALWLDINCNNCLVADNRFERCGSMYFEISRWGIIVNNVCREVTRGIWSYSSDVLIANNVLDRCGEGITITGDARGACYGMYASEPPHDCLVAVRNNMVVNNIIIDSAGSFIAIWPDSPHCGSNYSDYNTFVWTLPSYHWGGNQIKFMGSWDQYYGRLPIWQQLRGFDTHSAIADPTFKAAIERNIPVVGNYGAVNPKYLVGDPGFMDREKGDYRLRPGSPLRGRGVSVPMELESVYYPGRRAWGQTLAADAPESLRNTVAFEAWGQQHYRVQPEPEPLRMFEPSTRSSADPGLNESWSKTGTYPELRESADRRLHEAASDK